MKKLISILLVAMLVLGMFPATTLTAFAADTTIEFALGENGSASHYDGKTASTYSETVSSYTLSITGGTNMYTGARDAKGNSCFKLGTSSKAGSFTISNIPADVTSVVIHIAAYKAKTASIKINNGTATALKSKSDNGAYDAITVDTTSNKTINLAVSSGNRAMVNTITYVISATAGSCEHTNTTEQTDGYAAQCGKTGMTNSVVCDDCGEIVTAQTEIPALTHNYVDGTCEHCGEAEPAAPEIPTDGYYKQVTALSDVTAGGKFVIVAANSGTNYAMNLGTSGKLTTTEVTVVGDSIVADDISTLPGWVIVPTSGGIALQTGDDYLAYGSSGTDFTSKTSPYTWTVTGSTSFRIIATTGSNRAVGYQISGNQFGGYSTTNSSGYVFDLTLYKLVEGEAEVVESTLTFKELGTTKTETAEATKSFTMPAATVAAPTGYTFAGWVEAQLLEETAVTPETVYAAGSSYTVGNDATFYALYTRTEVQSGGSATAYVAKDISEINDGDVVVITMTKDGTIYALPNNGGASAAPSASEVTENADGQLVADFENILWDLDKDGNNLTFYVHGSTEKWLYSTDTNNGVRVGTGNAKVYTIDKGYLMNTPDSDARYIGVYNTQDWRCYKLNNGSIASNIANQTLTFYVETLTSEPVETTYYTTCVHSYASVSATAVACAYCGIEKAAPVNVNGTAYETIEAAAATGKTVILNQNVENAVVSGELKLDLNGHNATNVTATKIYAIDSSAKRTESEGKVTVTAGTGSLTTTSKVVMDNTVDGVRYIALENEGAYTFHILEMKLSAVSLRTSAAGIYYKAIVNCDEVLAGAVSQYGIALSTRNMPGANFATESELNGDVNGWTVVQGNITSGQAFTSGSVFGIFKNDESRVAAAAERNVTLDELNALYGEVEIYANAYIKVGDTFLMADTTNAGTTNGVAWSLKDVMVKLNETFTALSEKNQKAVAEFYGNWSSAMDKWEDVDLSNISAAANLPA